MAGSGSKRLSPIEISRISTPGNHVLGDQLYLRVRADGSRSWAFRYRRGGKQHWLSLGPVRDVTLSEAREAARKLRNGLREGIDPMGERRERQAAIRAENAHTFDAVAALYIATHRAAWKNEKHGAQWGSTLATYASPVIGGKRVSKIGLDDVLAILKPIWTTKPETASRLRGRIEAVLGFATVHGWRTGDNPARWDNHLSEVLPSRAKLGAVQHHAALPWADMPSFMMALRARSAMSARCLEFTVLTAARSGEARGARWSEIDMQAATWTVPAERMKAKRDHRVPLSPRAITILTELMAMPHRPDSLIFPGGKAGAPMSDVAVSKALHSIQPDVTVHGMRSSFRDWAADQTDYPREVAEACLAHVNKDRVEAAYRRGDALDQRRRLMNAWALFCESAAQ